MRDLALAMRLDSSCPAIGNGSRHCHAQGTDGLLLRS
jgi:hypothetical protein